MCSWPSSVKGTQSWWWDVSNSFLWPSVSSFQFLLQPFDTILIDAYWHRDLSYTVVDLGGYGHQRTNTFSQGPVRNPSRTVLRRNVVRATQQVPHEISGSTMDHFVSTRIRRYQKSLDDKRCSPMFVPPICILGTGKSHPLPNCHNWSSSGVSGALTHSLQGRLLIWTKWLIHQWRDDEKLKSNNGTENEMEDLFLLFWIQSWTELAFSVFRT